MGRLSVAHERHNDEGNGVVYWWRWLASSPMGRRGPWVVAVTGAKPVAYQPFGKIMLECYAYDNGIVVAESAMPRTPNRAAQSASEHEMALKHDCRGPSCIEPYKHENCVTKVTPDSEHGALVAPIVIL